jgi:hypothetical protein
VNLVQAFVRNVGTCRPDAKGEAQGGLAPPRARVPKPGTGAEWLVVVMKAL